MSRASRDGNVCVLIVFICFHILPLHACEVINNIKFCSDTCCCSILISATSLWSSSCSLLSSSQACFTWFSSLTSWMLCCLTASSSSFSWVCSPATRLNTIICSYNKPYQRYYKNLLKQMVELQLEHTFFWRFSHFKKLVPGKFEISLPISLFLAFW